MTPENSSVDRGVVIVECSAWGLAELARLTELAAGRCGRLRLTVVTQPRAAVECCAPMAGLESPLPQAERVHEAMAAALRAAHAVPDDVLTDYCVVQSWRTALATIQPDRWELIVVGRPSRIGDRVRLRRFAQSRVAELRPGSFIGPS